MEQDTNATGDAECETEVVPKNCQMAESNCYRRLCATFESRRRSNAKTDLPGWMKQEAEASGSRRHDDAGDGRSGQNLKIELFARAVFDLLQRAVQRRKLALDRCEIVNQLHTAKPLLFNAPHSSESEPIV